MLVMDGQAGDAVRYCGRSFTTSDLAAIRTLVAQPQRYPSRAAIAREMCRVFEWVRIDGRGKEMSARLALVRMERDGLISLPPPRHRTNNSGRCRPAAGAVPSQLPVSGSREGLPELRLVAVTTRADSRVWNEMMARHHYLGYQPLPGAQMRYLIVSGGMLLGGLGFGAAAWKIAPRDKFIGWTPGQREARLHLVVNNARFLLLPWVTVKNLASSVLALAARRIPDDWAGRYAYRPVLLETFVQQDRFAGTCYRAANWVHVGATQGRGKLDRYNLFGKPIKDIYLFPLHRNFRQLLTEPDQAGVR